MWTFDFPIIYSSIDYRTSLYFCSFSSLGLLCVFMRLCCCIGFLVFLSSPVKPVGILLKSWNQSMSLNLRMSLRRCWIRWRSSRVSVLQSLSASLCVFLVYRWGKMDHVFNLEDLHHTFSAEDYPADNA